MILAYCTTYYHLFNVIQLKRTLLKDFDVDLVLSSDTEFKLNMNFLENSNLFRKITFSPVKNVLWTRNFNECSSLEQSSWFIRNVKKGPQLPLEKDYTDLYIGLDDAYNKFLYYSLVEQGMNLNIHFFEEGTASYVLSIMDRAKKDNIPHEYYKEKSFISHIKEILLYEPNICSIKFPFAVNRIPSIVIKMKRHVI